jgi:hypothetical protein
MIESLTYYGMEGLIIIRNVAEISLVFASATGSATRRARRRVLVFLAVHATERYDWRIKEEHSGYLEHAMEARFVR